MLSCHCKQRCFGSTAYMQFLQHERDIVLYRFLRQVQLIPDLAIRESFGDPFEDGAFTRGQILRRILSFGT